MMENTNEANYNDLFVDNTANNIAEKVDDSNDFYEDEVIDQSVPVANFDADVKESDNYYDDEIVEKPIAKLDLDNEESDEESNSNLEENIFSFNPKNSSNENIMEVKTDMEEPVVEDTNKKLEPIDKKPFEVSSLSNEEMDKMIEEDKTKEQLDDSYVLSNFDVLFDSLYNDVNGANNFISNLIEQKKNVNLNEATLNEQAEKLVKEKEEFAKYMEAQKESIESEKQQCNEYIKNQKIRLQNEEEQFNSDMEAARAERKLAEESLKIEEQKLNDERQQFEKYKEIEEQKIRSERQKFETEKEQFEKEKEIDLEKIKSAQKELEVQKEQFAKTKELEEKKLELESKNLSQSCARFKELVSQFNSGFQQLPEDK